MITRLCLALSLCAGCTALTDFDRFAAGNELNLGDDGGSDAADAASSHGDSGSPSDDSGAPEPGDGDGGVTTPEDSGAPVGDDAGAQPTLAPPVTGSWRVTRANVANSCGKPLYVYTPTTWKFTEDSEHWVVATGGSSAINRLTGTRLGNSLRVAGGDPDLNTEWTLNVTATALSGSETTREKYDATTTCIYTRQVEAVRTTSP